MPGLYIHVPFCARKCAYCDFYSVPLGGAAEVGGWLAALETERRGLPADFRADTVFVGGGTPTALPPEALRELLALVNRVPGEGRDGGRGARAGTKLSSSPSTISHQPSQPFFKEFTVEANPGTLTPEKLEILRAGGVNRLSLGVQSFDDDLLHRLGRIHTAEEARAVFRLARAAGFDNLGLDLIFAIPGQTMDLLRRDLAQALKLAPEHISCYALSIEDGTPLARTVAEGGLCETPDDEQRAQYDIIRATLAAAGYEHYEISNFARPGRRCRHNQLYWTHGEYLGLGPAAHSHWRGARWGNAPDLEQWQSRLAVKSGRQDFMEWAATAGNFERLAPEAAACEALVMGLRLIEGWDRATFRTTTGFDWRDLRGEAIDRLVRQGLLLETPDRLRLAPGALFVSNVVFSELV